MENHHHQPPIQHTLKNTVQYHNNKKELFYLKVVTVLPCVPTESPAHKLPEHFFDIGHTLSIRRLRFFPFFHLPLWHYTLRPMKIELYALREEVSHMAQWLGSYLGAFFGLFKSLICGKRKARKKCAGKLKIGGNKWVYRKCFTAGYVATIG